jgi:hypothetical protein
MPGTRFSCAAATASDNGTLLSKGEMNTKAGSWLNSFTALDFSVQHGLTKSVITVITTNAVVLYKP